MPFQFGSRRRGHDNDDEGYDAFVDQLFGKKKKAEPATPGTVPHVSDPSDAQEKEAGDLAAQVAAGETVNVDHTLSAAPSVQTKKEGSSSPEVPAEFHARLNASKGGGQSLPESTRTEMEGQMGADFSGVKLHTGSEADALSQNVQAKAFTHGQDIYFRQGQFNPASQNGKELLAHELVHTRQQGLEGSMIQRDDYTYKVTDRISSNGKINQFALRDEKGDQISYDKGEEASGPIFLPEGTKVVKLPENPLDPNYIGVTVWYKGKYRQGFVHKSAFGNPISEDSAFAVEAFITDAERTVYSAEELYESEKKRLNQPDTWRAEFKAEILEVKNSIKEYTEGKLKITNEILKAIKQEDVSQIEANADNRPATLQKLSEDLYSTYNPQVGNQKTSEATLFVPLTPEWFNSTPITQKFYTDVWEKPGGVLADRLGGTSGEVLTGPQDIADSFAVLGELRTLVAKEPTLKNTPEAQWLINVFPKSSASQTQAIILIHNQTWFHGASSPSYASFVPLEQSFGMLRANPVMSVMVHEMNMATSYVMGETHISASDTKAAWNTVQQPGGLQELMKDPELMDNLFQSHSGSGIIILSHYFKRIREKQ